MVTSKKPVTTVVVASSDTVPLPVASPLAEASSSYDGSGPRSAGARRSAERSRGSRKVASTPSPPLPTQLDGEES